MYVCAIELCTQKSMWLSLQNEQSVFTMTKIQLVLHFFFYFRQLHEYYLIFIRYWEVAWTSNENGLINTNFAFLNMLMFVCSSIELKISHNCCGRIHLFRLSQIAFDNSDTIFLNCFMRHHISISWWSFQFDTIILVEIEVARKMCQFLLFLCYEYFIPNTSKFFKSIIIFLLSLAFSFYPGEITFCELS